MDKQNWCTRWQDVVELRPGEVIKVALGDPDVPHGLIITNQRLLDIPPPNAPLD